MRKCMKNFNFKLDYNEIDRIIEENDEGNVAGLEAPDDREIGHIDQR